METSKTKQHKTPYRVQYSQEDTGRYRLSVKTFLPKGTVNGVILGVHGFAGDKESSALARLAGAASDKGIALLCFDFPAHGNSEADERFLTVENCRLDLLYAAELCRIQFPGAKKYLFATSFGGYIALLCMTELSDFQPVLRAPAVTMPEHILTDLLRMSPEEFQRVGTTDIGFDRIIRLPFRFWEDLQRHRVTDLPCDTPMLIVHGDRDDIVPPEDIRRYCETHPNAFLYVVGGADHRFKGPGELKSVIDAALSFWGLERPRKMPRPSFVPAKTEIKNDN